MKSVLTKISETIIYERETHSRLSNSATVLGRICFSLIFIAAGLKHFSPETIAIAASQGLPFASVAVPFSGILALAGGLSIMLGYRAKLGAWLIMLFLIPVTITMHKFWGIAAPTEAQMQMAMFMKNVSMLGGALIISQFGAGPVSFDTRRTR